MLKIAELKECPLCKSKTRWCGEDPEHPEEDHFCTHIVCTNAHCSADFSFPSHVKVLELEEAYNNAYNAIDSTSVQEEKELVKLMENNLRAQAAEIFNRRT